MSIIVKVAKKRESIVCRCHIKTLEAVLTEKASLRLEQNRLLLASKARHEKSRVKRNVENRISKLIEPKLVQSECDIVKIGVKRTMSLESIENEPVLSDAETLSEVIKVLEEHIPLKLNGDYQAKTIYQLLLHAASHASSVEQSSQTLEGAPTGNTVRYHLGKLDDMATLEDGVNNALASRIPGRLTGTSQRIAIDLNLLPYYGEPSAAEEPYIVRSQAKDGTCSFYGYATAYVILDGKRITLGLHAVRRDETMVAVLTHLFDRLSRIGVGIKRLSVDRGFYSVPVIRWLQACDIPFIMPVIIRGKQGGTRALLNRKSTRRTNYTMKSPLYGSVTFEICVVGTYQMGRRGEHGVEYMAFAIYRVPIKIRAIPGEYRKRFGVECSYRQKNLCRIHTSTKNPVLRLLYVAIAFMLVNLWTFFIWTFVSRPRRGRRILYPQLFPLRTMLQFLRQAIERHLSVVTLIFIPQIEPLSSSL